MQKQNWKIEDTRRLFALAEQARSTGAVLADVFRTFGAEIGMDPKRVRNYYYTNARMLCVLQETTFSPVGRTFEVFSEEETERLIATVLTEKAKGGNVRKIVTDLADGDEKLALRYQNKFRSVVFRRREKADAVIDRLIRQGATFYHPYEHRIVSPSQPLPADEKKNDARSRLEEILGSARTERLIASIADALAPIADGPKTNRERIDTASVSAAQKSAMPQLNAFADRLMTAAQGSQTV